MRSLVIDTSSFFMLVAVMEENQVLASYEEEIHTDMASKIVPTIELLFEKVTFSIEDIDKIFIVNGPGSFTGLRVGVTVAKTIAWALHKEVIPISSLELMATTEVTTPYIIPAIDARRGYVYAGVYDQDLNVIMGDKHLPFEELSTYLEKGTLISRDNLENSQVPKVDLSKMVTKHKNDKTVHPHALVPNYLKLTEAEENKAKKE